MKMPSLNYAVLIQALTTLKQGNIRQCEALGFTYDELDTIAHLSLEELFLLCRETTKFLNVVVDHEALKLLLKMVHQESLQQLRISRSVALGGSIELLGQFFGLSSGEVCARRRFIGVNVAQGRNRMPDEETDAQIWSLWQQRRPASLLSMEALDVMMDITEELSADREDLLLLNVVWSRIVEIEANMRGKGENGYH